MRTRLAFMAIAVFIFTAINRPTTAEENRFANWSGLYFGAQGTYLTAHTNYANPATPVQDFKGWLAGGLVGYNFQFKQLVIGAEADGSWGKLDTFIRDGNFLTENGQISWLFTLRGRVGYALGNFLPYATVGGVWTRLQQGTACPSGATGGVCLITGPFNIQLSQTFSGWTYGGGVEYAFAKHWSIKAEALWTKLDNQVYTAGTVSTPVGLSTSTLVRAGVNFHI